MAVNTKVNLSGLTLDNPVIPASGTYGFGKEYRLYLHQRNNRSKT